MIVDTDLLSLETEVRDHIGEDAAAMWTQAAMFRAINAEFSKMCRSVLNTDPAFFGTTYTETLTSATVTLPRHVDKVLGILVYRDSRWYPIQPINTSEVYIYQQSSNTTAYARACRFEGRTIVLEPGYANVSQVKVYYGRAPAPRIYGQASAGAATTITLATSASLYDDIYIGDEIEILSGTGNGQTNTISDYVGSTKVATVTTWSTNPDATSYYSTLLPEPVNKYPSLLCLGAAARLMNRRRDGGLYAQLRDQYLYDYQEFENDISPRQTDQPRYGEFVPREDDW